MSESVGITIYVVGYIVSLVLAGVVKSPDDNDFLETCVIMLAWPILIGGLVAFGFCLIFVFFGQFLRRKLS